MSREDPGLRTQDSALVRGGQGRTGAELERTAESMLMMVAWALAVVAGALLAICIVGALLSGCAADRGALRGLTHGTAEKQD